MSRTSEDEIAIAVLRIAASHPRGIASFQKIKLEMPNLVPLTDGDKAPSKTRNGEPMWHQIIRNIKSHHAAEGNFIEMGYLKHVPRVGYAITDQGRAYLAKRGYPA